MTERVNEELPEDEVPRKLRYLEAHPGHRITGPQEGGDGRFHLRDSGNNGTDLTRPRITLKELLDDAEWLERQAGTA